MSELRELAERVLLDFNTGRCGEGPGSELVRLCHRVLAEHPADSSEPVTWEWLEGLGFRELHGELQIRVPNGAYLCFEKDGEMALQYDTADRTDWVPLGYEYRTREDVRNLLRGLKVEVTG